MRLTSALIKRFFCLVLVFVALISCPQPSWAVGIKNVPNPRQVYGGWVMDTANLLNRKTINELNQTISQLEAKNGSEIAVVTVADTKPYNTPRIFATRLFNYWGIGKAGIDNGVLLSISKGDRRIEIVTGYGLSEILPDADVVEIINQQIVPEFKQGKFDAGILAATKAVVAVLQNQYFSVPSQTNLFRDVEQPQRKYIFSR